ncbi:MAG: hypothetical protein EYC62_08005 [Alphaproteobacteria bacterium]|nr:MAG: hypothetical protein EYC62_08005 [Alphaproteobacteria bacterium]
MVRANFGMIAAFTAATAFGTQANADIWEQHGSDNTAFATSERMTGREIDGIEYSVTGDNLFAFTGVANSRFITIISPASNQPGIVYVLDKDGKPFPVGSGYNDITQEGVDMIIDIGDANVGKEITFVFGNYGTLAQNGETPLFNDYECGQIDPDVVATWTLTGGQNQFGSETRVCFFGEGEVRGVPKVSTTTATAAARARATRCCD